MKRLLLLLSFCLSFSALKAQSAGQTLEWLNIKKNEIGLCSANYVSNTDYKQTLEIDSEKIKLSNDKGAWVAGAWHAIKEIKSDGYFKIRILYSFSLENRPGFIELTFTDSEMRDKYSKALHHMASLKGAKLIDSNLF